MSEHEQQTPEKRRTLIDTLPGQTLQGVAVIMICSAIVAIWQHNIFAEFKDLALTALAVYGVGKGMQRAAGK